MASILQFDTDYFLSHLAHLEWNSDDQIERSSFIKNNSSAFDWKLISKQPDKLSSSTLDTFFDFIHWDIICRHRKLTVDFFQHFPLIVQDLYYELTENPSLSEYLIDRYSDLWSEDQWKEIFPLRCLSIRFRRKYFHKFDWCEPLGFIYNELSPKFIHKYSDKLNFDILSECYPLKSDKHFFIKYKDKLDWVTICLYTSDIIIDGGCRNILDCSTPFSNKGSRRVMTLIELIDCKSSITRSLVNYSKRKLKYPDAIYMSTRNNGKKVPKLYHDIILNMACTIDKLENSASLIKKQWRKSISNPIFNLCRTVLTRDFNTLITT